MSRVYAVSFQPSASGPGTVSIAESQPATAAPAAAGGQRPATSDPEDALVVQDPDGLVLPNNGGSIPHKWPCSWRTWWSGLILGPFSREISSDFRVKKCQDAFPWVSPEDHDPLMAGSPSAKESGNDTKALEGRKMYGYPVGSNQGGGEGAIRLLP